MRRAKVASNFLLCIPPLLRPNNHHALVSQTSKAAHHRPIVGKQPIAAQLQKSMKHRPQIIQSKGSFGMSRQLHPLNRRQIGENLSPSRIQLLFDPIDLIRNADPLQGAAVRIQTKLLKLSLQLGNRLLKFKMIMHGANNNSTSNPLSKNLENLPCRINNKKGKTKEKMRRQLLSARKINETATPIHSVNGRRREKSMRGN